VESVWHKRSVDNRLDKPYAITYAYKMPTVLTASEARANLYRIIDEAADSHEPISITGKRANAVLVSESDWNAIQETLYLLSIPGMRESIKEGMATPAKKLSKKLGW
jgi:antitoxin YefM